MDCSENPIQKLSKTINPTATSTSASVKFIPKNQHQSFTNEFLSKQLPPKSQFISGSLADWKTMHNWIDEFQFENQWSQHQRGEGSSTSQQWVSEFESVQGIAWKEEFEKFEIQQQEQELQEQQQQQQQKLEEEDYPYQFEPSNPFLQSPNPPSLALANQLYSSNQLTEASLALEALILSSSSDPSIELAWSLLGKIQAENEKEYLAIAALKRALELNPLNEQALMNLAVCQTNEGREETVLELLSKWFSIKQNKPLEINRDLLINSLLESPADPQNQQALGIIFYNSSDFEKAADCFRASLQFTPNDALVWNRLGATLANSGQHEQAIQAYRRSLEIRPMARTRYNLGIGCMNIGCWKEAANHLMICLEGHQQGGGGGRWGNSRGLWDTLKRCCLFLDRRDLADEIDGVGHGGEGNGRDGVELLKLIKEQLLI